MKTVLKNSIFTVLSLLALGTYQSNKALAESQRISMTLNSPHRLIQETAHYRNRELPASIDQAVEQYLSRHGRSVQVDQIDTDLRMFQELDHDGTITRRYQRIHMNIPFFGPDLKVTIQKEQHNKFSIRAINGTTVVTPITSSTPLLTKEDAIEIAKQLITKNSHTLKTAKSELIWWDASLFHSENQAISSTPVLAYLVTARTKKDDHDHGRKLFVIAATDTNAGNAGSLLKTIEGTHHDQVRGVFDCSTGECIIGTDSAYPGIRFGRYEGDPAASPNPFVDTAKQDTNITYNAMGHAYSLFQRYGRDGANRRGGFGDGSSDYAYDEAFSLTYTDAAIDDFCPNAAWDGSYLYFCWKIASSDIVGHEYTHAITEYSANLIYERESGALNESYSDIFAEGIESRATNSPRDYLKYINTVNPQIIRSMKDPSSVSNPLGGQMPDRFYHPDYYCGTEDNGGVHINSGVQNKAAYLMAEGGTFNGCQVGKIGAQKMEDIFYHSLENYLLPTSGYNNQYQAMIQSCWDLNFDSYTCTQVAYALRAVEMDQPGRCSSTARRAPDCSNPPTKGDNPPPPAPGPDTSNDTVHLSFGKTLLKRRKRSTSYLLSGRTLNENFENLSGKTVSINCLFIQRGRPVLTDGVELLTSDIGYGVPITVKKKQVATCDAKSGSIVQTIQVRYKKVRKKKKKKKKKKKR